MGFSLREPPQANDHDRASKGCPFLDGPDLIFGHPLSLGFDFWDIVEEEDFSTQSNGMNLLPIPDTYGLRRAAPGESCLLAIDMELQEALLLEEKFGLCLLPMGLISHSENWKFLGYDVIAPGGLTSGLFQYDWAAMSDREKRQFPRATGNEFGLVARDAEARLLATHFNDQRLHHAPYFSMSVWAKLKTKNGEPLLFR